MVRIHVGEPLSQITEFPWLVFVERTGFRGVLIANILHVVNIAGNPSTASISRGSVRPNSVQN